MLSPVPSEGAAVLERAACLCSVLCPFSLLLPALEVDSGLVLAYSFISFYLPEFEWITIGTVMYPTTPESYVPRISGECVTYL